jgi:endonuclease III
MEKHKTLFFTNEEIPDLNNTPKDYFKKASEFAYKYYGDEIKKISNTKFDELTPHYFFNEFIWVVHTSGFSAKAVSKFFNKLVIAYGDYEELSEDSLDNLILRIKNICNNKNKANSILKMAKLLNKNVQTCGWKTFRDKHLSSTQMLTKLPHIGEITCFHLARNIGILNSVKPDLHLARAARHWGYDTCESMCHDLQPEGIPLGIVDLILWYSLSSHGSASIK